MRFAILIFPGSGCDIDVYHAIKEVLGEEAEYICHTEADFEGFDAVIIPSGASYGDYLRPGALAQSSQAIEGLKAFAAIRKTGSRRRQWIPNPCGSGITTRGFPTQ